MHEQLSFSKEKTHCDLVIDKWKSKLSLGYAYTKQFPRKYQKSTRWKLGCPSLCLWSTRSRSWALLLCWNWSPRCYFLCEAQEITALLFWDPNWVGSSSLWFCRVLCWGYSHIHCPFFFFSPVSPASQSSLRLQTPISKHPLNVSTWNLAVTLNYTWASPPPCVHSCPSPPIFKTNRTTVHQHVQAQSIVVILKSSFSQFPWAILQQLSIIPSMYSHSSLLLVTSTSSTLVSHLDHCKRPLLVPRPLPLPSLTPWPENAFKTHRGSHHFTAQISSIECKILWPL